MLEQVSGASGSSLPEWQMTHPLPENREAAIRDEIAATGVSREGTVNRDPYIRRLDGLVYGEDPRQGYFEGQRFLHPDMAFELTFPTGWSTVNQRTIVGAVSPSEDAVVVLGVQEAGDEPAAALRAFLAGDGISGGSISQSNSGNVSMARADFQATSDDGSVSGTAAFARLGDVTYRMLGYASPAQWASYRGSVDATIRSFDEVSDPQVLGVQPLRLRIVQLSSASSLTSWVRTNPQPLELEALGAINRVAPNAVISAGALVKTVVGTPIG